MAGIETRISDAVLLRAFEEFRIAPVKSSLPLKRRLAGYALAAVLALVLAAVLTILDGQLDMTIVALAALVAVIAVALLGGLVPAVLEAIAGSLDYEYGSIWFLLTGMGRLRPLRPAAGAPQRGRRERAGTHP